MEQNDPAGFIANLVREHKRLKARLAVVERLISAFREYADCSGELERDAATSATDLAEYDPLRTPAVPVDGHGVRLSGSKTRIARIAEVLRSAGHPLYAKDIVAALREQGDGGDQSRRKSFANTVDSALRSQVENGLFRKVGKFAEAKWELGDGGRANRSKTVR